MKDIKERIEKDKTSVSDLCKAMSVDIEVTSLKFAKRLGQIKEDGSSRPLLVGFTTPEQCDMVLAKSPTLAEMEDELSEVNMVRDLTKLQRKEEMKLREEVLKKNGDLDETDAENWVWKVVGRRGERKVVKVSLEKEEEVKRKRAMKGRGGANVRQTRSSKQT